MKFDSNKNLKSALIESRACMSFLFKIFRISLQNQFFRIKISNGLGLGWINMSYCLTKITSPSAARGKQFNMFEKHFPSLMSAGDFFGETGTAWAVFRLDVSRFSFESRLSRDEDDCDVDSSEDSASVMFSKSLLLSQSYICKEEKVRILLANKSWRKESKLLGKTNV